MGRRGYMGQHFTLLYDNPNMPGAWKGEFQILAFGQVVAYKGGDVTLRTAELWGIPWLPEPGPWVPWALAALLGLGGFGLAVLVVRGGLLVPMAEQPALAATAWALVVLLVIPPLPARGGGGGGTAVRRWLVTDHLGSGVVWLDEAGERQVHREYAPFGKLSGQVVVSNIGTRIYAGHRREETTGLDYMQARWYTKETGTFMSVDPVVPSASDPQSYNAYAYARNNPVALIDPRGAAWYHVDSYTQGTTLVTVSTNSAAAAGAVWLAPFEMSLPTGAGGGGVSTAGVGFGSGGIGGIGNAASGAGASAAGQAAHGSGSSNSDSGSTPSPERGENDQGNLGKAANAAGVAGAAAGFAEQSLGQFPSTKGQTAGWRALARKFAATEAGLNAVKAGKELAEGEPGEAAASLADASMAAFLGFGVPALGLAPWIAILGGPAYFMAGGSRGIANGADSLMNPSGHGSLPSPGSSGISTGFIRSP